MASGRKLIVVTGGAGFIGSNLLADLEARASHRLVACDRLGADEKWRNIAKRELDDVIRPEALFHFLEAHSDEVEAIFHMGACSSTTERDADYILENNLRLSIDLWDWCAGRGVRLIYASSAATYGDGSQGFSDADSPDALARLRPLNPYGWSKHAFDRRVARIVADGRLRPPQWAGLKFFNAFGPNEYHKGEMRSVIAKKYELIASGKPVTLFKSHHPDYPDGGQKRDFVWVGDCSAVMLWLFDNPHVNGLFNVGTGVATSFNALFEAAFEAVGVAPNIKYIPMPDELDGRYQYFTQADLTRLRKAGYAKPFLPAAEAVARYIEDYLSQPDPYR